MLSLKNLCLPLLTLLSCKINSPTRSLESEFERAFFKKENELDTLFDTEKKDTQKLITDHTENDKPQIIAKRRKLLADAETAVTKKENAIKDLESKINKIRLRINNNHPPLTPDEINSLNRQRIENQNLKEKTEAEKTEAENTVAGLGNRVNWNGRSPYYTDDFDDTSLSGLDNIWKSYKEGTLKQREEIFARYYSQESVYKPNIQLKTRNLGNKLTSVFSCPVIQTETTTSRNIIERMEFVFFYLGSPTNLEISKAKDYLRLEIYQKTNKEQDWYHFLGFDNNLQPHRGLVVKDEEIKTLIEEQTTKPERKSIELSVFKEIYSRVSNKMNQKLQFNGKNSPYPLKENFFP